MNIEELIKNPTKLEDIFRDAISIYNKELINPLLPFIRNPDLIYRYASEIVGGKISDELEDIIAQDTFYSYHYAHNVLKGPFPKGEDTIAKNVYYSYHYAHYVLEDPFPKGENAIARDAECSYKYALDVLKDRFKKGERMIVRDSCTLNKYKEFLKSIGKLEEFEREFGNK
jgi:lambda repressor-like predicted transcriptional regulator